MAHMLQDFHALLPRYSTGRRQRCVARLAAAMDRSYDRRELLSKGSPPRDPRDL